MLRRADATVRPSKAKHPRASLAARRTLQVPVPRHTQIVSDAPEHTPVHTHATAKTAIAWLWGWSGDRGQVVDDGKIGGCRSEFVCG